MSDRNAVQHEWTAYLETGGVTDLEIRGVYHAGRQFHNGAVSETGFLQAEAWIAQGDFALHLRLRDVMDPHTALAVKVSTFGSSCVP